VNEPNEPDVALAPTFELTLRGEGLSVDRKISADVARDVIALVLGSAREISREARGGTSGSSRVKKSLREVLDEAEANKNPQIITVIGAQLTDSAEDRFTRSDVKTKFAQAGEPMPANFARDFALAVSSGWIAEDQKGEFYVTDAGHRAITAKFVDQRIRRPRRRSKKKEKGE